MLYLQEFGMRTTMSAKQEANDGTFLKDRRKSIDR